MKSALALARCCCAAAARRSRATQQYEEPLVRQRARRAARRRSPTAPCRASASTATGQRAHVAPRDVASACERASRTARTRTELLKTVHYEATRAGLDPQLVLGVIEVESRLPQVRGVAAPARAATCR